MPVYFADTSFWIGISLVRDQHHRRALGWHEFVRRTTTSILTTKAVLWEWLNALSDVTTRRIASEGYGRIKADSQIEVVALQPELVDAAIALYRTREDKSWSFTDCLSFVVMERRGLRDALTTDRDFEQAGFGPLMLQDPPR